MVQPIVFRRRSPARRSGALLLAGLLAAAGLLTAAARPCSAQLYRPDVHYFQSATQQPPGTVAAAQALRGGPVVGYYQPVEVTGPKGTLISIAQAEGFVPALPERLNVALVVGHMYRFRVGNIPFHPDQEVYPTIELINRTYPPEGQKLRFPLPIILEQEDLEMAIEGHLVTRVIFIEDPRTALPASFPSGEQRVLDVTSADDPLYVADRMGRPIAILRMGSRVPDFDAETGQCLFATPPFVQYAPPPARQLLPRDKALRGLEDAMERRDYPRVPVDSPLPPVFFSTPEILP